MWEVVGSISFHLVLYLFLDSPKKCVVAGDRCHLNQKVAWCKRQSYGGLYTYTPMYAKYPRRLLFDLALVHESSHWCMDPPSTQSTFSAYARIRKTAYGCSYSPTAQIHPAVWVWTCIQDSRLLYYHIREIKRWLNINHTTVHNNTYSLF